MTMHEYIHIEFTCEDPQSAISHLRRLAEMIAESPRAPGWSISDREGSSLAEWRPVPKLTEHKDPNHDDDTF